MKLGKRQITRSLACALGALLMLSAPSIAKADDAHIDCGDTQTELTSADGAEFNFGDESGAEAQDSTARTSSVTGVTIGTGFRAARSVTVDQQDVYGKALTRVKYWRQDALNSGVKVYYNGSYVTIRSYLSAKGISESEYLNPSWSNDLEHIAIQRSIEAGDASLGHYRPDGSICFTAKYNGYTSNSEILAWNSGDRTNAIDLWAKEKSDYVRSINGESVSGQTGHYETLISPAYKAFGFAKGAPYSYGYAFAGEASSSALGGTDCTNLNGKYYFETSLSSSICQSGDVYSTLSHDGMAVGQKLEYYVWPAYLNRVYCLGGEARVEDETIASVASNTITALKRGFTTLKLVDDAGYYFAATLTVKSFSDVNSDTSHLDDINWLSDEGISTGWSASDGSKEFRPYTSVARADMAAFLYRLAGSPTYTAPSKSPFSDVTTSTAYYKEICWLASSVISKGWDMGGGKKEFRPFATVARADMAAFLYRLAGSPSYSVSGKPFADCNSTTPHYKEVCWLASTGVSEGWSVSGGKEFRPYNTVARADMATFLHRMSTKGLVRTSW